MSRIARSLLAGLALVVATTTVVVASPVASTVAAPNAQVYIVKPGDYLLAIAKKLKVSLDELLDVNGLTKKSVIHAGDELIVPSNGVLPSSPPPASSGELYTVKKGDYLKRIAQSLGVSIDDLLAVNQMKKTTVIHAGMQLKVPSNGVLPSSPPPRSSGELYTVKKGDYLKRIAQSLGVSIDDLLAVNQMKKTTVIHTGMQLKVPVGGTLPSVVGSAGSTSAGSTSANVLLATFPVGPTCAFVDTFGEPRSGGRVHEGVDIMVRTGTPIYAVVTGTITKKALDFVGSRGGNSLRLTMPNGTYFFYGHLSAFEAGIQAGSAVTAGQLIGYVGSTGNASVPHLHFEVHPRGGAAVNPYWIVRAASSC